MKHTVTGGIISNDSTLEVAFGLTEKGEKKKEGEEEREGVREGECTDNIKAMLGLLYNTKI